MVRSLLCAIISKHYVCAKCGSGHLRRNGSSQGHAKYQCKACGNQARFAPAAAARAGRYAQVEKLLVEGNSQRSIVRATGVARMTLARLIEESDGRLASAVVAAAQKGEQEVLASAGAG